MPKFDKFLGRMRETDGDTELRAEDIIVRKEWDEGVQDYEKVFLSDTIYEMDELKMGAPEYYSIEENITHDTEQSAPSNGWVIVTAQSDSAVAKPIEVMIEGTTITKMSCESGHWQTVVVPVVEGTSWSVTVPDPGADWIEWNIRFVPSIPLYYI